METKGDRNYRTAEFFSDIVDSFDEIKEAIEKLGHTEHSAYAFHTELKTIVPELAQHGFYDPSHLIAEGVKATISPRFSIDLLGDFVIDELSINLGYTNAIYAFKNGTTSMCIDGDLMGTFEGRDTIDRALRLSLPSLRQADAHISTTQIAQGVMDISEYTTRSSVLRLGNIAYFTTELDTPDDSSRSVEIRHRYPHASGSIVEQRVNVRQASSEIQAGIDTKAELTIQAGVPIAEFGPVQVIGGKIIKVAQPTELHLETIRAAIENLYEEAQTRSLL